MKYFKQTLIFTLICAISLPFFTYASPIINIGGRSMCKAPADIKFAGSGYYTGSSTIQYSAGGQNIAIRALAANTGTQNKRVAFSITPQTPNIYSTSQSFTVTIDGSSSMVRVNSTIPVKPRLVATEGVLRQAMSGDFALTDLSTQSTTSVDIDAAGPDFAFTCTGNYYGHFTHNGKALSPYEFEGGIINTYEMDEQLTCTPPKVSDGQGGCVTPNTPDPTLCISNTSAGCSTSTTIQRGSPAYLTLNPGGSPATNCTLTPDGRSVGSLLQNVVMYPTVSTNYELACYYNGVRKTATAYATVEGAPTCTPPKVLNADGICVNPTVNATAYLSGPSTIVLGNSIRYTITSSGTRSCKIVISDPNSNYDDEIPTVTNGTETYTRPRNAGTVTAQLQCLDTNGQLVRANTVTTRVIADDIEEDCIYPKKYDPRTDSCVLPVVRCYLPEVLDHRTGRCTIPTVQCTPPSYWDHATNRCKTPIICPANQVWSHTTNRCEPIRSTYFNPGITVNGEQYYDAKKGEKVNLEWRIPQTNDSLEYCSINPAIGRKSTTGGQFITATADSVTYKIVCYDEDGIQLGDTDTATIYVDNGGDYGPSSTSYIAVETGSPLGVTDTTAQLRGSVTRGTDVDTWFVVSDSDRTPSCDGGPGVARVQGDTNRDSGSRNTSTSPISGLTSGITYYYRICGSGQGSEDAEGVVRQFTAGSGNTGSYTNTTTTTTNTNTNTNTTKKQSETVATGDPLVETLSAQQVKKTSAKMRGNYNANGCPVRTWFEWSDDKSDLFKVTNRLSQNNTYGLTSAYATGLRANKTYYYRIVAQHTDTRCGNGAPILGNIMSFRTTGAPVVVDDESAPVVKNTTNTNTNRATTNTNTATTTTKTVTTYVTTPVVTQEVVTPEAVNLVVPTTGAGTSYLRLDITNGNDVADGIEDKNIVIRGEIVQYYLEWENLTDRDLNNGKIRVNLPASLKFVSSTRGLYDADSHSIYINIGNILGRASDEVVITTEVLKSHAVGESVVVEAIAAFDDPFTLAQINAIDYDQDTIGQDRVNTLQASAFGTGFLGLGTIGWVVLLFVIGLVFLLARYHALANAYRTNGASYGYYGDTAAAPAARPVYTAPVAAAPVYRQPEQQYYGAPQNIPTADVPLPDAPAQYAPDYSNQGIYRPYDPTQ
jgi:hypothetical protein